MTRLYLYMILFIPILVSGQPVVHKGVFYRDEEGTNSGFLADKAPEIQNHLNYMKENGVYVNILLMSKECPGLDEVEINNKNYFKGPSYSYNNQESSLWGAVENQTYTFQFLPRQARLYHPVSAGNSFWSIAGADFDYPLLLHNNKYWCLIVESINAICTAKGLNLLNTSVDCEEGEPVTVDTSILILPKTYLNKNTIDLDIFKSYQIIAKTNFCSNLFYYGPYLHTRSTDGDLTDVLSSSVTGGFVLVTALPKYESDNTIFRDVILDLSTGSGYPDNCYPTIRELSEQNRLEVLHIMHGGNNSGASSNLNNVKKGSEFMLERLLSSANSPIPGKTNCGYGSLNGGDGNGEEGYNYIPDPEFKFHGPPLSSPENNGHVKWHNNFDGIPGGDGVVEVATKSAEAAAGKGVNLEFHLGSGCTPLTPQFEQSRSDFESDNPAGASVVFWMYYDECDHRLYYDIKVTEGFTATMNPGYGITNPDSIAAIREAAENLIKGIFEEVSKMSSYQNADLHEAEYPENVKNEALSAFFGYGTSCTGEAPWNFGIRDGYKFEVLLLVTECLLITLEIIKNQQIPQRLWHPQPADSCMLDMPGVIAGIIDPLLNIVEGKTWFMIGLLNSAVEYYKADAATRKEVLKALCNPFDLILGQYPKNFQCVASAECQEERMYCFANLITNLFLDIFGKGAVSAVSKIANVGNVVDDKLKMLVPTFNDKHNVWKRTLSQGSQQKLHKFMEGVSEAAKFKLAKQVTLSKIWQKFDAGQLPGISKGDLQKFIERLPAHDQHDFYDAFDDIFSNELGEIIDPEKVKAFIGDVNSVEPSHFIDKFNDFPKIYLNSWDISNASGNVHLRKNIGFLSTVGEFYDKAISQKFKEFGCTLIEEATIRHYTGDYHYELNLSLVGTKPMTDEFLEFKNTMNQGLNKLPNHIGIVFRGLGEIESNLASQWEIGQTIDNVNWDKKFVSASTKRSVAENFRINGGGNVIVKIDPSNLGKLIEAISKFGDEGEVTYSTGMQFRVIDKKIKDDDPSVIEITLQEI